MQTVECEVVTDERLTLEDLRRWVEDITGGPVAVSTFRYWRKRAGVVPDDDGFYGDLEVRYLACLRGWLGANRANTIKGFKEYWHGNR